MSERPAATASLGERASFAHELSVSLTDLLRSGAATLKAELLLWHGSLPLVRGGTRYDIDIAVFFAVDSPLELLRQTEALGHAIHGYSAVTWRAEAHYDGMRMWEAHTHFDPTDYRLPHIGVHTYRTSTLLELAGPYPWAQYALGEFPFFRVLDSWRRFSFFFRHWVYEGRPYLDTLGRFATLLASPFQPTQAFISEFREVLLAVLRQYELADRGLCSVDESRSWAVELVAAFAYAIEGMPIGRSVRYADDQPMFADPLASTLLRTAIEGDLSSARDALESYALER